jgi:hypothetical protein
MILGIVARSFRRLAAGAIALTAVSGCSLLFVEGPPHDHASRHFFDCTTSMLAPGMDATLTGALALSVLGVESDQTHTTGDIVMQSALVVGAMASATYGYLQVSKCRQAKDDLGERLINMPYLGVPPWDASRAPPPSGGAPRWAPPPPAAASSPTNPPTPRDPWLSEGPPPPLSDSRREPTSMPPPPPYLRVAPHTAPPAMPPPAAASSSPAPPPPSPDAGVAPAAPPPPPAQVADPESAQ